MARQAPPVAIAMVQGMMVPMGAYSGNRRIVLVLLALVGAAIALHLHALRVHGVRIERRPAPKAGAPHRPARDSADRHGTQSGRILRHIQDR